MNTLDRLARPLHEFTRRGPTRTFDVEGWTLLRDHPTVIFGDGGSLKSYLALFGAGQLAQQGIKVLLVDWELDAEDHRERFHRLYGEDVPKDVFYLRAEGPLVKEIPVIAREVQRHGIEYLVCDSIGAATDGAPEAAEHALRYFRALRQLSVRGSLHLAHITKGESSDQKPFGSVFWHNWARMTWFVRREGTDEQPYLRLINRKANLTAPLPEVDLQFEFGEDRTTVSNIFIEGVNTETEDAGLSIRQRAIALIRAGGGQPMTVAAIAEALGKNEDSVARIIRRNACFVKLPGIDGKARIGLSTGGPKGPDSGHPDTL